MTYEIRAKQHGHATSPAPRLNGRAGRALGVRASEGAQFGGEVSCTNHSSIFNGHFNCVAGAYSSILGGNLNYDNGVPFTGMYGSGMTALPVPGVPSAFWVNELVVPNMPGSPAGLPFGSLYYQITGLGKQVFIA